MSRQHQQCCVKHFFFIIIIKIKIKIKSVRTTPKLAEASQGHGIWFDQFESDRTTPLFFIFLLFVLYFFYYKEHMSQYY
jgi:hypothetical protein